MCTISNRRWDESPSDEFNADWLEPTEASFSIGMRAAVAELADRTQLRKWSPQLDNVLMASHIP
jgi:hypothetical protein